ncbi:MAG: hypothetical protein ABI333_30220 [bacterium]
MGEGVTDITVEILTSIREELRGLRQDTNARFEQMDQRFERMDQRFERIEVDIRAIAGHFDRDVMTLAGKVGELEGRLDSHLNQQH